MSTQWKNKQGWYYAYTKVRRRLLDMNARHNGGKCCLQLDVCTGTATQVHHVLGVGVDKLNPNYMLPCCAACNMRVGDPATHSPPHTPPTSLD